MSKVGEQIFAEALKLSPVERAELVENLLTILNFHTEKLLMIYGLRKLKAVLMPLSVVR